MKLMDLLEEIDTIEIKGEERINIENIYYDSRKVTPNSLFICIEGFQTDGHHFIDQAIKKGAIAIVAQKDMTGLDGVTWVQVKDTRQVMAQLGSTFYGRPSQHLELIGVTGTNGKTSTTYMIKKILENHERKVGLIGTIANWIGNTEVEAQRTTPESIDLQQIFKEMADEKVTECVMEVSSHALALERVAESEFKVGVFTNLTPEHLDFHENIDNYREAKKKLFYLTTVANVINIDDPHGAMIAEEVKKLKPSLITFGIKKQATVMAKNIATTLKDVTFDLVTPVGEARVTVKIPGIFSAYNALASIATSIAIGVPFDVIVQGIQSIPGVPGRFESVLGIKDFSVIVDYAHTPDAIENVIQAAKNVTEHRVITVFGCGGDRDRTKRSVMGEISGSLSDLSVITSDNPRTEDPYKILMMIEAGIKKTKGLYTIIEDRREAIRYAMKEAKKGDIVLIAGKGHEATQQIGSNVIIFDDCGVAREIAKEEGLDDSDIHS
ncbi:UDP-N-acetylmuramyl-tripeptide synthetase [Alkaliphilus metalliredigens QYMF]|uniref:UDP-N-acetylmuramoyl-L-alanyl-D-glutamate--2,6-diaminopimelate ligase n=1 Tax=Alkaliphilus metalliredigens (strain QYMF) TaxID=293826 RepID=MURE_ALKMQ|nr:UDP-N-acetylmuramoyl-L-alanyl-D-glutamate--2,6-diaminopimelate ligase [Alkaliphilus metalliredigens]A6TS66.1 RecName: Full=UDP-N-acetylmuramoyl-L-alanyl-D-glutamate--2,6-diaminopimelate ligase; AltName: Full=Meso-A2pm-adding enzyme; AltName: Full=Meso-diaminopimelate-adding enzyme; AltName: Full=UDP-MurNAc-L-Ala-D-Glu:meso-diaminopimelate ligase; AltName: Full=UDP-MurNAc-tripeptide synthetase; AltName: Full=UDP-N-acetylmuramyl-tripeptide synthetase [Alkaliphilus metalliredigens QYMF]ABR49034.1